MQNNGVPPMYITDGDVFAALNELLNVPVQLILSDGCEQTLFSSSELYVSVADEISSAIHGLLWTQIVLMNEQRYQIVVLFVCLAFDRTTRCQMRMKDDLRTLWQKTPCR